MVAQIAKRATTVPQNITTFLRPIQSENQPKVGAPIAKPMKIMEVDWAARLLERLKASEMNATPQRPPKTMTGANANPL